jgi:hypothetical protein
MNSYSIHSLLDRIYTIKSYSKIKNLLEEHVDSYYIHLLSRALNFFLKI